MTCSHSTQKYVRKIWEDDYGKLHESGEWVSRDLFEDIDLHRYRCTRCGLIEYYSSAAQSLYEGKADKDTVEFILGGKVGRVA